MGGFSGRPLFPLDPSCDGIGMIDASVAATIKRRLWEGVSQSRIAAEFSLNAATVSKISTGRLWHAIEWPDGSCGAMPDRAPAWNRRERPSERSGASMPSRPSASPSLPGPSGPTFEEIKAQLNAERAAADAAAKPPPRQTLPDGSTEYNYPARTLKEAAPSRIADAKALINTQTQRIMKEVFSLDLGVGGTSNLGDDEQERLDALGEGMMQGADDELLSALQDVDHSEDSEHPSAPPVLKYKTLPWEDVKTLAMNHSLVQEAIAREDLVLQDAIGAIFAITNQNDWETAPVRKMIVNVYQQLKEEDNP